MHLNESDFIQALLSSGVLPWMEDALETMYEELAHYVVGGGGGGVGVGSGRDGLGDTGTTRTGSGGSDGGSGGSGGSGRGVVVSGCILSIDRVKAALMRPGTEMKMAFDAFAEAMASCFGCNRGAAERYFRIFGIKGGLDWRKTMSCLALLCEAPLKVKSEMIFDAADKRGKKTLGEIESRSLLSALESIEAAGRGGGSKARKSSSVQIELSPEATHILRQGLDREGRLPKARALRMLLQASSCP